ncbi:MAG: cupin domain-containing protein [Candidatus Staskawiczbacteria bacterium]|nr:cupin domain-containing protein [Candidatus Staskawiczbacteria bacterium]
MASKLQQAVWAQFVGGQLISFEGEQPLKMQHSDGTARPLVVDKEAKFGADIVRFAPGDGVGLHTHVGAHILFVAKGTGILTYDDEKHGMFPGLVYGIPSNMPHAIDAITELMLLAVGNDHKAADSPERLDLVQRKRRKKRERKPTRPHPAKS